jgi:hypothetical protein
MMEITNIQIAQGIDKRDYLTSNEYLQLMSIANKSTLLTGYAVFEACGMLGIHPIIERNIEVKTRSSIVEDKESSAFVYPNPTSNTATVKYLFEEGQGGELLLYSIEGKLVKKYVLYANESERSINISNLDEGIYLYSIYSTKGNLVNQGKLVVLR